jgi:hypothetical protein
VPDWALPGWREYGTDAAGKDELAAAGFAGDGRPAAGGRDAAPGETVAAPPFVGRAGAGFGEFCAAAVAEFAAGAVGDDCGLAAAPPEFAAVRPWPFDGGFDSVTAAYPYLQVALSAFETRSRPAKG